MPHAVSFGEQRPRIENGVATRYARTHHLLVAWSHLPAYGTELTQASARESFVILLDNAAEFLVDGVRTAAPARSISILPPGASTIVVNSSGTLIRLFAPVPGELASYALNASAYVDPREGLRPIDPPFRRVGPAGARVYPLAVGTGPKPQSFQTDSMSVGWFEKNGPENRAAVNPHSHADFEEGSLMVRGTFVQHLRSPWGTNIGAWQSDEHLHCEAGTLVVIAPGTMHVAEAVGEERHVLMNLFAPPRRDHIAKGQILNAGEYAEARIRL
jgi:mannose-6-phosphate isomerase-like protein (cupin superfamily)